MSRYIDADKLRKNEIARCHCVPCVGSNDYNYKDLDEVLDDIPTADVVEVVRCKDCAYYDDGECIYHSEPKEWRGAYERWTVGVNENDFCSCGERKEK